MADHTITITPDPACENCQSDNPADWCGLDPWSKKPIRCLTWTITCPGITEACRAWYECCDCNNGDSGSSTDLAEHLEQHGEAHGVEHQYLDVGWCTPTDECSYRLDQVTDSLADAINDLETPIGTHAIYVTWDDGADVTIKPLTPAGGEQRG